MLPSQDPGYSDGAYIALAVVAALLFFVSLLLHELGHALQARREGVEIEGINLWLFVPCGVELVGELVEDASARLGHGKEPFERERLHPGKVGAGGEHAARGGAVAAQGDPRQGVVRHAEVSASGALGAFTDLRRAPAGDARGSSQNNLAAGFLGDYNYALATNDFGVATWNDVRAAADCPAIDAYRQALYNFLTATSTTQPTAPAPNNVCPATFGNTDIFGGSYADPTLP